MILLITNSFLSMMVGSSFVLEDTFESYISPVGCHFFWLATVIMVYTLICGGFVMALFRLIVIRLEVNVTGAKKVMQKLIAMESIMVSLMVIGVGYGNYFSGTSRVHEFCKGRSYEMNKIIALYHGSSLEDISFGLKFTSSIVAVGQIVILIEFIIYVYLYVLQYRHNKLMASHGIVAIDVIAKRHRKNVITMSSQALTFAYEWISSIVVQVLIHSKIELFDNASSIYIFFLILTEALISIFHFWSSPELRRFYGIEHS